MSGLCPPVPTELVSVLYLKTGSVQQEQECSSLTSHVMRILAFALDVATAEIQPTLFPTERRECVDLESAALMKVKFSELKSVMEPWSVRHCRERLGVDHCPLLC